MRTKDEILSELKTRTNKLDEQHQDIALLSIIETEIMIDIRDILDERLDQLEIAIRNLFVKS